MTDFTGYKSLLILSFTFHCVCDTFQIVLNTNLIIFSGPHLFDTYLRVYFYTGYVYLCINLQMKEITVVKTINSIGIHKNLQ